MLAREGSTPTTRGARRSRFWSRKALLVALALVLVPAAPASAEFSSTPDNTWGANGRVYDVLRVGSRVYIAGSFTQVRSPGGSYTARSRLAAFDATTNALITTWVPSADNEVYALAASSDGTRIYAGGAFTTVNGVAKSRAASLDATTGALRSWKADANEAVRSLAVSGTTVYMGGKFTNVNGSSRGRLAAVSYDSGALRSWRPSASYTVRTVKVSPDATRVFVGGNFTTVSGLTRNYAAAIDAATGAVTSWAPAWPATPSSSSGGAEVIDLEVTSSTVYVAGAGLGGRAAAFDASTGAQRWFKSATGDVQAVAYVDGRVFYGGHFEKFAGVTEDRFAAVNATSGAVDASFSPSINLGDPNSSNRLGVWALSYSPSHLYFGGDFTLVNGARRDRSTRFVGP